MKRKKTSTTRCDPGRRPVMDPECEKPTLLNFVLRVLAPDGQLYEIDGTGTLMGATSIGVYLAEYRADRGRKELAPRSRQWDKGGEFPWDAWRQMGELGLLGFRNPPELGGQEIDLVSMGVAMEE